MDSGEDIALPARVARVAADAVALHDRGDADFVAEAIRSRAGGILDPTVAEALAANADELLAEASVAIPASGSSRGSPSR